MKVCKCKKGFIIEILRWGKLYPKVKGLQYTQSRCFKHFNLIWSVQEPIY